MASARPIIATDVSDFPDILADCGLISAAGNQEALRKNIEKVLDEPEMAAELGKKAREKCLEKYSQEFMSKKLTEFFNKFG